MKRWGLFLLLLIVFFSNINIFGISIVDLWEKRYFNSQNIKEKRENIINISKKATKEYEPLIVKLLRDQRLYVMDGNRENFRYYEDCVLYVVEMMLKFQIKEGNRDLLELYKKVDNPIHRGMIAEAIGMINDPEDLKFLNLELETLNRKHRNGTFTGEEKLLLGVMKGLDSYKSPTSFYELFYTSRSNYPTVIKEDAQKVLKNITDDPAPLCRIIIEKNEDARMVLEALYYGYQSGSPKENKLACVQAALLRANLTNTSSAFDSEFVTIRDESCRFLGELKDNSPKTIKLLEYKWKVDVETFSRLITIESLKNIGTEESGKPLAEWLDRFIDRKNANSAQSTVMREEDKILKAVIRALGDIPGDVGTEELFKITPKFGNPIVEEARKSLEKKGIVL